MIEELARHLLGLGLVAEIEPLLMILPPFGDCEPMRMKACCVHWIVSHNARLQISKVVLRAWVEDDGGRRRGGRLTNTAAMILVFNVDLNLSISASSIDTPFRRSTPAF